MSIRAEDRDIKELIMGDRSQFHIPIYQRVYTWEADNQIKRLLDDIIEFGKENKDNLRAVYYIGNAIVKNQTRGFINERVVIDGQQRITTTILILCAIRDVYLKLIKTEEAILAAHQINKSLFSEEGNEIKLKLNNMEYQSTLKLLLTGQIDSLNPGDKKTKYYINYKHIYDRLAKYSEDGLDYFVRLLERIKVVIIFLDEDQDENSVFESINSLGKPLAGSDLIKNYIFTFKKYECSHSEEEKLTNLYTKSVESLFDDEKKKEEELEKFFREYIAVKTFVLVKNDPKIIYNEFKKIIGSILSFSECKNIILDLSKWAEIYQLLRKGERDEIDQNNLKFLRAQFGTYASLLMDIVEKHSIYEDGYLEITNAESINSAFKVIVAYDASRFLAGFSVKEITRYIPKIPKNINHALHHSEAQYISLLKLMLFKSEQGYRAPTMIEINQNAGTRNVYKNKKQLIRLLILIENINKNELLDFEKDSKGAQIEHIMPQTLNENWTEITESEHEEYLHTLGNLTITYDNQGLSNKSFIAKKRYLKEKSKITLNSILEDYDEFGPIQIKDRLDKLLLIFYNEYPYLS